MPSVAPPIDWDLPLQWRKGSQDRLLGIDVFFDFEWNEQFSDNRVHFKNGKGLARLLKTDCPSGKRPVLLLTARDEIKEGIQETDSLYIMVINLPRYRRQLPDAAAAYCASRTRAPLTRLSNLLQPGPVENEPLDREAIAAWVAESPERLVFVRDLATMAPSVPLSGNVNSADVVEFLSLAEHLDPELVAALVQLVGQEGQSDLRQRLLTAVTADRSGRRLTAQAVGRRRADRLSDLRDAASEYETLVSNAASGETDMQHYLTEHPWLLGLDFTRVLPRRAIARGEADFLLERYDGTYDLLELKSPTDDIIVAPAARDGAPPSASKYVLSPALANALAQAFVYRGTLHDEETAHNQFGLGATAHCRIFIIIGRRKKLANHQQRVLEELNRSFNRVEVIAFDDVATRALVVAQNIERLLTDSAVKEVAAASSADSG